jgi:integrase
MDVLRGVLGDPLVLRTVPLPRFLPADLEPSSRARSRTARCSPHGAATFCAAATSALKTFDPAVRLVGPAGFHPHELRHTVGSLAIASGADVEVLQRMLGHKTATLTLDLYGPPVPDRLDDLADRMDAAVSTPDVNHTEEDDD